MILLEFVNFRSDVLFGEGFDPIRHMMSRNSQKMPPAVAYKNSTVLVAAFCS